MLTYVNVEGDVAAALGAARAVFAIANVTDAGQAELWSKLKAGRASPEQHRLWLWAQSAGLGALYPDTLPPPGAALEWIDG